jgi:hypothetical protein
MLHNTLDQFNQAEIDNLGLSRRILELRANRCQAFRLELYSSTPQTTLEQSRNDEEERYHEVPKNVAEN